MPGSLHQRVQKLEAASVVQGMRGRILSCIVRKGREEEDQAEVYRAAGIVPAERDRLILRVVVSPEASDQMNDIVPSASVLRPF